MDVVDEINPDENRRRLVRRRRPMRPDDRVRY
jgi:hypothetical protein